ncbi:MAG: hypothetical protein KJS83_08540 [Xanthomonadaceae bacterium]|nr:hypothetical protein [Xanthomonadaceae bacterium]MDE2055340.1 hypothetical protein [Xanthomonadaceae bacterium]
MLSMAVERTGMVGSVASEDASTKHSIGCCPDAKKYKKRSRGPRRRSNGHRRMEAQKNRPHKAAGFWYDKMQRRDQWPFIASLALLAAVFIESAAWPALWAASFMASIALAPLEAGAAAVLLEAGMAAVEAGAASIAFEAALAAEAAAPAASEAAPAACEAALAAAEVALAAFCAACCA